MAETIFIPDRVKHELIVERVFDAPRELVWKAWTEPERLAHWWGPRGWATTTYEMDVKPGGVWFYCMRGPEGMESWCKTHYQEIVEPERLVYLDTFSDPQGNLAEGMPHILITTEFTEHSGKTKVTSYTKLASVEDLDTLLKMGVKKGLIETWDRLAEYLATT